MKFQYRNSIMAFCLSVLTLAVCASTASQTAPKGLKAGAARIDITPTAEEMPAPFTTVAEHIFARVLVLDNGTERAVIVIDEVPTIQAKMAADLIRRIAETAHVPESNVLLGTTHTHNSIRVDSNGMGTALPGSTKFSEHVIAATMIAVQQALENLQPARAGYAVGSAALIANRNEWSTEQHRYHEGVDRTGTEPIDRRLGVFKVETPDGKPIAFLLNYGIEPVVEMARNTEIGGDVPGSTARYIEDRYKGNAVVLFSIGSAGTPMFRGPSAQVSDAGDAHQMVSAMGTVLGEEVLATAKRIRMSADGMRITSARESFECPGKATKPLNLVNQCAYTADSTLPACVFKDTDAPAVTLSMGLLRLGDLEMVEADANVVPALWMKLVAASPLVNTQLVALTYGPLHFVVDDAAYPLNTYEATASTAKQGCAEQGFMNAALEMIEKTR